LALPWGSRSITRTRSPIAASAVARLMAVVVLPTPPFWLAIVIIRVIPAALNASGRSQLICAASWILRESRFPDRRRCGVLTDRIARRHGFLPPRVGNPDLCEIARRRRPPATARPTRAGLEAMPGRVQ